MLGCLKTIIKNIIIVALIIAFFMFGGYDFVKKKINEYQKPPRNEFIETERNYGDFSNVPSDYQLCRSFNIFGYKKVYAKHLPTNLKIAIYDLKDSDFITSSDFSSGRVDKKIKDFLYRTKDALVTFEDFKIISRGNYMAHNKKVPYILFTSNVKNLPFKTVMGIIACYPLYHDDIDDDTTILVVSHGNVNTFNPMYVQNFLQSIRF